MKKKKNPVKNEVMKYASIPGDSSIKNIMPARIKVQSRSSHVPKEEIRILG